MKYSPFPCAALRLGLACMLLMATGCELDGLSSGSDSELAAISLDELNEVAAEPQPAPESDSSSDEETTQAEDTPAPAPVSTSVFTWDPRADSIRVLIPASLPHWKFWVFSRRKHVTLYGPDMRSNNRPEDVEYILNGNGAAWRQKSLDAGDDGTLLIVVNTRDMQFTGYRNAGWRIMNPSAAQSGDGDRLQLGQDR